MARAVVIDIGGEGRHEEAWNVNPSALRTIGAQRGEAIPRRIAGRADALPFRDECISRVIVERTPLLRSALEEIARVIATGGTIFLRHAQPHGRDPHLLAKDVLTGEWSSRIVQLGSQIVQETEFRLRDEES